MKIVLVEEQSRYNDLFDCMFDELNREYDFQIVVEDKINKGIERKLKSHKVQKMGAFILNFIFSNQYHLYEVLLSIDDNEDVIVIFLNSSFIYSLMPYTYLKKCKLKNIKFVLFFLDIVEAPQSRHAYFLVEKGIFDRVFTFDKADAEKYGYEFFRTPYSRKDEISMIDIERDLYFCGGRKGRTGIIKDVLDGCRANNINVDMDVICSKEDRMLLAKYPIRLHDEGYFVSYNDVLKESIKAKCILDIVQVNQKGLTIRPYEAVTYNRKLLTNNKAIFDFEYYNEKYMRYFESIEDIDWDWIKEQENINYNYQGDYSPNVLLGILQ